MWYTISMEGIQNIPIENLRRCPLQLRVVRKESMDYIVLRDSIRDLGILQSLLVRPVENIYEVVAGNHRYEIAVDLRILVVPCIVRELSDKEVLRLQIVENADKIETRPIDYCRRLQKIIHNQEMTVDELAFAVHRHPDWIRKLLSLNYLSKTAKKLLDKRKISCILAVELAKLPVDEQDKLLGLKGEMSSSEYLELLRSTVRNFRGSKQQNRIQAKRLDPISFRHFRKVKDEYLNKVEKGTILTRKNAKTPSDGWDAAFEWILSCDEESLARRAAQSEQAKKKEARQSNLQKLELERRKHEYRIDETE